MWTSAWAAGQTWLQPVSQRAQRVRGSGSVWPCPSGLASHWHSARSGGRPALRVTEAWPTSLPRSDSAFSSKPQGNAPFPVTSIVRGQSGQEEAGGREGHKSPHRKLENLGLRSPPNSFCIFLPVSSSWKITVKKMKPQRAVRLLLTRRDPRVPK